MDCKKLETIYLASCNEYISNTNTNTNTNDNKYINSYLKLNKKKECEETKNVYFFCCDAKTNTNINSKDTKCN